MFIDVYSGLGCLGCLGSWSPSKPGSEVIFQETSKTAPSMTFRPGSFVAAPLVALQCSQKGSARGWSVAIESPGSSTNRELPVARSKRDRYKTIASGPTEPGSEGTDFVELPCWGENMSKEPWMVFLDGISNKCNRIPLTGGASASPA